MGAAAIFTFFTSLLVRTRFRKLLFREKMRVAGFVSQCDFSPADASPANGELPV